jgi:hypothetical protein
MIRLAATVQDPYCRPPWNFGSPSVKGGLCSRGMSGRCFEQIRTGGQEPSSMGCDPRVEIWQSQMREMVSDLQPAGALGLLCL